MYSYEDRIRAVKFYINYGYNAAYTVSKLGYPDASNLKHWYRDYSEANDLHKGRACELEVTLAHTLFNFYPIKGYLSVRKGAHTCRKIKGNSLNSAILCF